MIYLFEDRVDRMHNLLKENLEMYSDVLVKNKTLENVSPGDVSGYLRSLENMEVIIIHKSYNFTNSLKIEDLKEATIKMNKKIVAFSGGAGNAVINENEAIINSGRLYENLKDFLEHCKKNKVANLFVLTYGKTGFIKHQLKQFQNATLSKLLNYKNDKTGVPILRSVLTDLDNYLVSVEFENDKISLENFIKTRISQNSLPNKSVLQEQITKMVERYENS